jgi:hypothetical protein
MRTTSTYSLVRCSWRANRWPCQPSATCGPLEPMPSITRPSDSWSSVAAVIAVIAGDRAGICMMPVPRRIRFVWPASQARMVTASEP